MQKYIFLFLFLLLGITACEDAFETTLKVDPPPHTPQMTVHAFIMGDDEFIGISVGRSYGILDDRPSFEEQFLDSATVEIYQQGTLKYTLPALSEILPTGTNILPINYGLELLEPIGGLGDSFEIKVTHPDYGMASAVQYMPQLVQITSAIYEEDGGIGGDTGDRKNIVDITFTDPKGAGNYYEIAVAYYDEDDEYFYRAYTMSGDPNLRDGLDNGHLLSDQTFDGKEYTLRLDLDDEYNEDMVVVLRTITEDWYLYSKSMDDFQDSDEFGFFSEPVTVRNNIVGGLGIFAAGGEIVVPLVE